MRKTIVAALATAAALVPAALPAAAHAAPAGPSFPFTGKLTAAPGISPPAANDWRCRPTKSKPEPVVLVHGTFADMTTSWVTMAPALRVAGLCVFALDLPARATGSIAASAEVLAAFVDRVRTTTGAAKVDLVGHSQGGMLARYYVKELGGLDEVDDLVALAPSNHGTLLANLAGPLVAPLCRACTEQAAGSSFLRALNRAPEAPAPVSYTNVTTAYDEVVVPFTSGWLAGGANVTNATLQLPCLRNRTEHLGILFDGVALQWTLNALTRTGPASPSLRPLCV